MRCVYTLCVYFLGDIIHTAQNTESCFFFHHFVHASFHTFYTSDFEWNENEKKEKICDDDDSDKKKSTKPRPTDKNPIFIHYDNFIVIIYSIHRASSTFNATDSQSLSFSKGLKLLESNCVENVLQVGTWISYNSTHIFSLLFFYCLIYIISTRET